MRRRGRLLMALALCVLAGAALAQELDFAAIPLPSDKDDIAAARLSAAEAKQILDQVEQTSFDTPDSWQAELWLRRLPIAGGTGNCETWLFRRSNGAWAKMFDGEAPVISGLGFGRHVSHEMPDLIATASLSSSTSSYVVYVFDGTVYRADACYEVEAGGAKRSAKKVACK
jgi:hypothetical protein